MDFDALRENLGDVAEGARERYRFTWPGKRAAKEEARRPIAKTMRPIKERSKNWDGTHNLYIEGDNLDALKILRETYAGKIKMIYIDPPYNTGHDFIYHDDFKRGADEYNDGNGEYSDEGGWLVANPESNGRFHSDWCSMIYPRLLLARDLLSDDGVIFISIDDNELNNMLNLCNEIYGDVQRIGVFQWHRRQNADSRNATRLSPDTESILVYAKKPDIVLTGVPIDVGKYKNPDNDPRGPWASIDLSGLANASQRPNLHFDIVNPENGDVYPPNPKRGWSKSKDTIAKMIDENRILWPNSIGGRPREKKFLSDLRSITTAASTWLNSENVGFTTDGTRELSAIFEGKIFDFPKPVELIRFLTKQGTCSDSLILDFFSGSATTAHAVMKLNAEDGGNRKFIMVQLPEVCDEKSEAAKSGYHTICEIGEERIRRAGGKIKAEVEKSNEQLELGAEPKRVPDIGFRVLRVEDSNYRDVNQPPTEVTQDMLDSMIDVAKPGRSALDKLFECLPSFQLPYDSSIEVLDGPAFAEHTVYSVNGGQLVACFDKDIPESVLHGMAELDPRPSYAVVGESGLKNSQTVTNFAEIFKQAANAEQGATQVRVI
ncbi:DNA methyltransferase [Bifidobacterium margollesii]|uniref:DNA methyltransferase n=1 Tax=Bifidobacterium margollesii TaxID=2020964 RepID=A0A2N5JBX8_9BIFI|nr:DNA methyltransferase [Bifidobacterium margollesii]